jgi:hypothetical protein
VLLGAGLLNLAFAELEKPEENFKFGKHVIITLPCARFVKKLSRCLTIFAFCLVFRSKHSVR